MYPRIIGQAFSVVGLKEVSKDVRVRFHNLPERFPSTVENGTIRQSLP